MRSWMVVAVMLASCGGHPQPKTTGGGSAEAATCEPGRCLADLAKLIEEHRSRARACYDQAKPTTGGKVIVNFEIDPEGKVASWTQSMQDEQITDSSIVDCIGAVIQSITFPPSAKGSTTRAFHRFEFSPKG